MTPPENGNSNGSTSEVRPVPSHHPSWSERLQEQVEAMREELDGVRRAFAKSQDEQRKRTARLERDQEMRVNQSLGGAVEQLLDVVDNLDLAIQAGEQGGDVRSLVEGVGMVRDMFLNALGQVGLERVEAVGRPFDPQICEAVGTEEVDEPERDNIVVQEHRPGYTFRGNLLRASNVVVGKYAAKQEDVGGDEASGSAEPEPPQATDAEPASPTKHHQDDGTDTWLETGEMPPPSGSDPESYRPMGKGETPSEDPEGSTHGSEAPASGETAPDLTPADLDLDEPESPPKDPNDLDW